jgi:hypothetical protein
MGREMGDGVIRTRPLAVAFLAGLGVFLGSAPDSRAFGHESAMTCINPASGARWQIRIDYERSTVDNYPARITDGHIAWRDASDGGNYTLDRRSGELTVVVASSTGGYFLHDQCKLDN